MGINILSTVSLLFFLVLGLVIVDADLAMQKKAEVKNLLELANHHATFAIDQPLKTEGIIELVEEEALNRFAQRMAENGGYTWENTHFSPSEASVTESPIAFAHFYVDFLHWQRDLQLLFRYDGSSLALEKFEYGTQTRPSGGQLHIRVITEEGKTLTISPKTLAGPSLVAAAYVNEQPLSPLLPAHAFPVVNVEELKW